MTLFFGPYTELAPTPPGNPFPSIGLGDVTPAQQTIASTIIKVEGYNPNFSPNNNPGNLVFNNQSGAVPGAGGFAAFPTYQDGVNALYSQIQRYADRGLTIDQMMNLYAPAGQGGNNPNAYAQTIASSLGVSSGTTVAEAISGAASSTAETAADDSGSSTGNLGGIDFTDPATIAVAAALGIAFLWFGRA